MPAERAAPHLEIPAMLLSFILSPLALAAVVFAEIALHLALGFDFVAEYLAALGMAACVIYWFLLLPVALVLRAIRKFSFWTVVLPAAVLSMSTSAVVALAGWIQKGGNPLYWFVIVVLFFAPGIHAVAVAFWSLYCFFTGQTFFSPPPWRHDAHSAD